MNWIKYKQLPVFLFCLLLLSCHREEITPDVPVLFTGQVVEIDKNGALYTGVFRNVDPDKVLEYGFTLSIFNNPEFYNSVKFSLPLPMNDEVYSYRDNSNLVPDSTYYLRTFVRYSERIYYGSTVSFRSMGSMFPEITAVEPETFLFGDTIRIYGRHFSQNKQILKVLFNEDIAEITEASDTVLSAIVPLFSRYNSYFTSDTLSCRVAKGIYHSLPSEPLSLAPPQIDSVTEKKVLSFGIFSLAVKGFHPVYGKVYIDGKECHISDFDTGSNMLTVHAPAVFSDLSGPVILKMKSLSEPGPVVEVSAPVVKSVAPDAISSRTLVSLNGTGLANPSLKAYLGTAYAKKNFISDTLLKLVVPEQNCDEVIPLILTIDSASHLTGFHFIPKEPEDLKLTRIKTYSTYMSYSISGRNFPEFPDEGYPKIAAIGQNGQMVDLEVVSYAKYSDSEYSVVFNIPLDLGLGESIRLKLDLCENRSVYFDNAVSFPAPHILSSPDSVCNFQSVRITGQNFNYQSASNKIYLDNTLVATVQATSATQLDFIAPLGIPEDIYSLKIVCSGVESNTVDIYLKERWKKISDLPVVMSRDVITFFRDDVFYLGGGNSEYYSTSLYSYNLNSDTWRKKGQLPVYEGVSVNDDQYGYLIGPRNVYRYDFVNDTWTTLSSLSALPVPMPIPHYYSGFLHNNRIFFFIDCLSEKQYYFDLITNEISSYKGLDGYTGSCHLPFSAALDGDVAHLLDNYSLIDLDLNTLSLSKQYLGIVYNLGFARSLNGIVYKDESYFYDQNEMYIHSPDTLLIRKIPGPFHAIHNKLFNKGNRTFIIGDSAIWEFNADYSR